MNKKWIAFLTAGVIAFSCMTAQAEDPARRSITVTGTSEVTAKSDMATVNVSVETSSPNVKAAVRENANAMTSVKNAVIAAGADASKIETQNYNVYPQQTYDSKGNAKTKEYRCTNTMKHCPVSGQKPNAGIPIYEVMPGETPEAATGSINAFQYGVPFDICNR